MRNKTWLAVILFASLGWGMAVSQSSPEVCAFDRAKMLALDEKAFDQDFTGGWRPLAMHDECLLITADLIRDYRQARAPSSKILFWHEGQMRAFAGQTEPAILLFEITREPVNDWFGWNLYVDATIAFLNKDKPALLKARATLAKIPKPQNFDLTFKDAQGRVVKFTWPPNINVVDDFIKCFDRPYKEAYRCVTTK